MFSTTTTTTIKLFNNNRNNIYSLISRTYFKSSKINKMKILTVPCNDDNYSYLIIDETNKVACAVDPCEPEKIIERLSTISKSIRIDSVLTTHHHWDHSGGNNKIKELVKDIKIYGGDERVEGLTQLLNDNEVIKVGSLKIKTLNAPAHTTGHVLYLVEDENDNGDVSKKALFTGDTLFICGCGRLFEGTPEQMYHALYNVIGSLPNEIKVYVGHEYTLKNLQFAKSLDPENKDILKIIDKCEYFYMNDLPTVPSTILEEKLANPFMRCHLPAIYNHYLRDKELPLTLKPSPIDVLAFIRRLKDIF